MTMRRRTVWLWLAVAVSVSLGVTWGVVPLADAASRLGRLPLRTPGVKGVEIELTDGERKSFGKASATKRLYRVGGQEFHLLVLDGTRDRHAVHDPLFCFRGAGWHVDAEEPLAVANGKGNAIRLTRGDETVYALYWFTTGREIHASAPRYWAQSTLRRMSFGASGDEPVLVLLHASDAKPNWRRVLRRFRQLENL